MATIKTSTTSSAYVQLTVTTSTNTSTQKTTVTCTATFQGAVNTSYKLGTVSAIITAGNGTVSKTNLSFRSTTGTVVYEAGLGTQSFTITHNSSGNGSCTIKITATINDVAVSGSDTVSGTKIYPTSCGAPTSVTASGIVTPSGTITVSWSGASGGRYNSISGYRVYYTITSGGTAPTTSTTTYKDVSSTSTSGSTTITLSSATRGYIVKFGVVTKGGAGSSYWSSIKTGGSVTVNRLPTAPTVTGSSGIVTPGAALEWAVTVDGTDADGQTRTLYYATSSTGTKTKFTSPLQLTASSTRGNATTYYFYTYDTLEYSSATTKTITINSLPSAPTVTADKTTIPYGGSVKFTLTATDANSQTLSYYYATSASGTKTAISSGGSITSITTTTTYYFWTRDSKNEYSSSYTTQKITVNTRVTAPTVSVNKTKVPANGGSVTYTITPKEDDVTTIYYSTGTTFSTSLSSIAASGKTAKTKAITITSNNTVYHFWTYNGYVASASYTSASAITVNTAPNAPTVSPSGTKLAKAGTAVSVTVTPDTPPSGESYSLYYATSSTGTKNVFTSPLSVTTPATTGNTTSRYFWVYDGMDYSSAASMIVKANTPPSKPTNATISTNLAIPGADLTISCTPGTDNDGTTTTVYYSATTNGTKTKATNPSSIAVKASTTRGPANFYLWSWDGIEYSSQYTTVAYTVNSLPNVPTSSSGTSTIIASGSTGFKPTINAGSDPNGGNTAVWYATTAAGTKAAWGNGVFVNPAAGAASTYYFWTKDASGEYSSSYITYTVKKNAAPQITSITASTGTIGTDGIPTGLIKIGQYYYSPYNGGVSATFYITAKNTNYNNISNYYCTPPTGSQIVKTTTATSNVAVGVTIPAYTEISSTNATYRFSAYDGLDYSSVATFTVVLNTIPGRPTIKTANFVTDSNSEQFTFQVTPGDLNNTTQTNEGSGSVWYSTTTNGTKTRLTKNSTTGYFELTATKGSMPTVYFWTHDGVEFSTNYTKGTITAPGVMEATTNTIARATYWARGSSGWSHSISGSIVFSSTDTITPKLYYKKSTSTSYTVKTLSTITNTENNVNYNIYNLISLNGLLNNIDGDDYNWYFEFIPSLKMSTSTKTGDPVRFPSGSDFYTIPKAPEVVVATDITNNSDYTNKSFNADSTTYYTGNTTNHTLKFLNNLYIKFPQDESATSVTISGNIGGVTISSQAPAITYTNHIGKFSLDIKSLNFTKSSPQTLTLNIFIVVGSITKQIKVTGELTRIPDLSNKYCRMVNIDGFNPYATNFETVEFYLQDIDVDETKETNWSALKTKMRNTYFITDNTIHVYKNDISGNTLIDLFNPSSGDTVSVVTPTSDFDTQYNLRVRATFSQSKLFDYDDFADGGYLGLTPSNAYNEPYEYTVCWELKNVFEQDSTLTYTTNFLPADTKSLTAKVFYNSSSAPGTYSSNAYSSGYLQAGQRLKIQGELTHKVAIRPQDLSFRLNKSTTTNPIYTNIPSFALTGATSNSTVSTAKLAFEEIGIPVNQTSATQVTYTLTAYTTVSTIATSSVTCSVAPQYPPEKFSIDSITIIKDEENYKLNLKYQCAYTSGSLPTGLSIVNPTDKITVWRSATEARPSEDTVNCLGSGVGLDWDETSAKPQLISAFGEGEDATYDVKNVNYIYLKLETSTSGLYSNSNIVKFYTPIRIAILQTPTLAIRQNLLGINVNDNELFKLSIASEDPKHFFVAQQFEQNSSIAYINSTKDQITLFNPSTQVLKVLQASGTEWTEERYFDFLHGIFK